MSDKLSTNPHLSIDETKKFYAELGIKMWVVLKNWSFIISIKN
jgi:hypothetical protein